MCRTRCVLGLVALFVGLVHSWDIAVSQGDQLIFYSDGYKTDTVDFASHNLTALAYDEVHNTILYVDKQNNNDAICGYSLSSKKKQCFIERNGRNIHSLAFDPVTELLFFTDTNEGSINWISLKSGVRNNVYGNLLIRMYDRIPRNIAVDSCRGYIYWTNSNTTNKYLLERARFNGSGREVLFRTDYSCVADLLGLVIDPKIQSMYYSEHICRNNYLDKGKLNGDEETVIQRQHPSEITGLTASKDHLYWIDSSETYQTIWQTQKNDLIAPPKEISRFFNGRSLSIAANYNVKAHIQGLQDCVKLSTLISTTTENTHNIKQTTETELIPTELAPTEKWIIDTKQTPGVEQTIGTEHTTEMRIRIPGYISTGGRCDVSVCENYCLQGNFTLNDDGLPKCSCNDGYSGQRCEVYACHNYCLNNGDCFLNEEEEPVCQCVGNHGGSRCEAIQNDTIIDTPKHISEKRNLTLTDLLAHWRKPTAKISVIVEV